MSVTSRPLPRERRHLDPANVALGILGIAFGAPLWLAGARYTLHGWLAALNWFLQWLGVPVVLSVSSWVLILLLMALLGVLYSLVEVAARPRRSAHAVIWLVWSLAIVTDAGSTFLGVAFPGPDAWPIAQFAATYLPVAAAWSLILTFLPEWLLLGSWRVMWK
jgi:hypothetical protein